MGEVYRARDLKLGRDVAIKLLPPSFAADEERLRRFHREARLLAALNHPNIATIFGLEEVEGLHFLALELVEGETLEARLEREPLTIDDALRLARQIADALDVAHRKAVIHRDLKPANVMLTQRAGPSDPSLVKLLDFGIARAALEPDHDVHASRLATEMATEHGRILGTPAYMSPESVRGAPATRGADVWAFGCVLYEMLAGRRAFAAGTVADTLARVLTSDPDWNALPIDTPPAIVALLRRCLEKDAGHRLEAVAEARKTIEDALSGRPTGSEMPPKQSVASPRAARTTAAVAMAAGLALLLVVLVPGIWRERTPDGSGAAPIRFLAVLPFANLSGDPDQEYFADGMTDALIAQLAQIPDLKVISRTSSMRYKGHRASVTDVARELGVDGVVEGGALHAGDRVRITAQLIRGSTDENLWAETYERDLRDVLALQSELARSIGRQIQAVVTPPDQVGMTDSRPVDPEVYRLTLQGRFYANQLSEAGLRAGIRYFEQAIARDAGYAPAHAGLAFAYLSLTSVYLPPREAMPMAREAALRAVALDDTLSEAHTWLGAVHLLYDWEWRAAGRELERALELNPNSVEARIVYGNYLLAMERYEESLEEARRALDLDPFSLFVTAPPFGAQWMLTMAREYDRAIDLGRSVLAFEPESAWTHAGLGLAFTLKGLMPEALAAYEEATRLDDSPLLRAFKAHGYAVAGRREESRRLLAELEDGYRQRYTCAYEIAVVHAAMDQTDDAFRWLDQALADRADCIPYLNVDPRWAPIRSHPRFVELLNRVGLPPGAPPSRPSPVDAGTRQGEAR